MCFAQTAALDAAALARARQALHAAAGEALRLESAAGGERVRFAFGGGSGSSFRADEFLRALAAGTEGAGPPPRVGAVLHTAAELASTQTLVYSQIKAFVDGAVLVADAQRQGKGRGGNAWTSPRGCLMATLVTEWRDGATLPFLQYVISLAVVRALRTLAGCDLGVRIKWPNDLYAGEHKVGGVLCQSTYAGGLFRVAIGLGLNVDNDEPTTCVNALLRAKAPQAAPLSREAVLAATLVEYERLERITAERTFKAIEAEYTAAWLHTGQRVTLLEQGNPVRMVIQGLAPNGFLLGESAAGERFELHPDGNSFDWMQGLVRRKLRR